jgi:hypothetical protein
MLYRRSSLRRSTGPIIAAGQVILRDPVNTTVGFKELAAELNKPSKSLHRMLAPPHYLRAVVTLRLPEVHHRGA